jgi:hypothetical protein
MRLNCPVRYVFPIKVEWAWVMQQEIGWTKRIEIRGDKHEGQYHIWGHQNIPGAKLLPESFFPGAKTIP